RYGSTASLSMTPDNLPLLGRAENMQGLWMAEAVWVTHAAGAARALVELMYGVSPIIPDVETLRPDRFSDQQPDALKKRSLRLYRDIYASDRQAETSARPGT
ncbi:MAG: sarcosine dehydrogenase, partial [Candidatus Binataceae bacterium]